jgi:prolipoprotein diacylglyceryltransferase
LFSQQTSSLLHLIFETLAFVVGYRYFLYLRARQADPIADHRRTWIFIGAAIGALAGSRILGLLEDPQALLGGKEPWYRLLQYKTMVGGLLGGLAGVELVKLRMGEKRSSGDLFTYPLILGIMIGRVGCFFNGTYEPTFGLPTTAWTGMDLGDGIQRHPVVLYEIAFLGLLWASLVQVERRWQLREGLRFQLFMIAYLGFRFFFEFLKPHHPIATNLSAIQFACLAGWLYYGRTIAALFLDRETLFMPKDFPRESAR